MDVAVSKFVVMVNFSSEIFLFATGSEDLFPGTILNFTRRDRNMSHDSLDSPRCLSGTIVECCEYISLLGKVLI
jgi:hypothetical protein